MSARSRQTQKQYPSNTAKGGYWGSSDTFIDEQNKTTNYGTQWYMQTYFAFDNPRHSSLVKFDLTGKLPSGAIIQSATLSLWVCELLNFTSSDWLQVGPYRVRQYRDWVDTQATWNIFKGSSYWAIPGCESTTSDRFETPDSTLTFYNTSQVNRYYDWNVTASVKEWVENNQANNGWLIRGVDHDGGTDGIKMNTNNGALDYRPVLTITYIPEPETLVLLAAGWIFLSRIHKR